MKIPSALFVLELEAWLLDQAVYSSSVFVHAPKAITTNSDIAPYIKSLYKNSRQKTDVHMGEDVSINAMPATMASTKI